MFEQSRSRDRQKAKTNPLGSGRADYLNGRPTHNAAVLAGYGPPFFRSILSS